MADQGIHRQRRVEEAFLGKVREDIDRHHRYWRNESKTFEANSLKERIRTAIYGPKRGDISSSILQSQDAHCELISSMLLRGNQTQCTMIEIVVHYWDQQTGRQGYFYIFKTHSGYIDPHGRYYQHWDDWILRNPLPATALLAFPRHGRYLDTNGHVLIDTAPGGQVRLLHHIDSLMGFLALIITALALVCAIAPINALFLPTIQAVDTFGSFLITCYFAVRDVCTLIDRFRHRMSISLYEQGSRWLRFMLFFCGYLVLLPLSIVSDFIAANTMPPVGMVMLAVLLSACLLLASTVRFLSLITQFLANPRLYQIDQVCMISIAYLMLSRNWTHWLNTQRLTLETIACSLGWHTEAVAALNTNVMDRFPRQGIPVRRYSGNVFFAEAANALDVEYARKARDTLSVMEQVEDILTARVGGELFLQSHVDLAKRFAFVNQHYDQIQGQEVPKFEWYEFQHLPVVDLTADKEPCEFPLLLLSADRWEGAEEQLENFLTRQCEAVPGLKAH